MNQFKDMLAPPPVTLPDDPAAAAVADAPDDVPALAVKARRYPESPLIWAVLAEHALSTASTDSASDVDAITAYALARTGYHRGLDRLRGNGWKGFGPVPHSHEPNRGVLRAIAALARAARLIGEDNEYDRCRALLSDCDPESVATLLDD
ncbi:DUF3151 domain-containing protein [Corynebacterium pygosceleis]|uniref:DUF3151 domain-containing protein n=1 Tax=Corynebacterium pygosceleis TaxID=2800406 RepID=A0A9Q4C9L9_9CORY|nr:DUF3151 domain-containing protein [Corynebacterium pygosceleis]MCK7637671.1 DUF3151 domain-containing protein [Corynebacterium pygosceleis]MCK7674862.1 DUF3151 domain-containing protein [Corynebacterium pygosceleis]MCL0119549.1 DUF3151 domain-containing protein [Corynebacterium pygosceleis]MCX7444789.1 DUF3151 domain-containing protein [Corynebacterium pygosceleis]MCX7468000.1 DUF3151 domain-containing protein [Corynebacterium pygosceleis]